MAQSQRKIEDVQNNSSKIPPRLPLPKGGENIAPFEKKGEKYFPLLTKGDSPC